MKLKVSNYIFIIDYTNFLVKQLTLTPRVGSTCFDESARLTKAATNNNIQNSDGARSMIPARKVNSDVTLKCFVD